MRLGRIRGIPVGINWSVLLILFLIVSGLSGGRFPLLYPDVSGTAYILAGVAAGVAFLLSLLAHEVAHALVARRSGVEVDGITLWMFGGVARLRGEPDDAGAELRISAVGPLVSLTLAAAFFVITLALDAAGAQGIAVGVFRWLAIINGVLAVFNLMPAAPLDGGRILRAFLWKRHGDRFRASLTATRAGSAFGWLLVGLGLLQFVIGAGLGGLWLVLIGWFITMAAGVEEQQARLRRALTDVRVADVMTPSPTSVPATITVAEFIDEHLFRNRFSAYPLVENGDRAVGLITLNRIKQVPPERRSVTKLKEVGCVGDDLVTARSDEQLVDVLPRLGTCSDGRAIVVDDDRLVGIVSPTDIARYVEVADVGSLRTPQHV